MLYNCLGVGYEVRSPISLFKKNGLFMSNEAGDKKSEATEVTF